MQRFFLAAATPRRRTVWAAMIATILVIAGAGFYLANREQLYDPSFDARVGAPAYRTDGPRVLFDEAHRNVHTASGRYKGFADLIANDGYDVQPNRDAFSGARLTGASVLVIVGARGSNDAND